MARGKKDVIPLVVVGCDFRVASTLWRERMLLSKQRHLDLHKTLSRLDSQAGFVSLVTCNRSEWIVSAFEPEWIGNILFSHIFHLWEDLIEQHGHTPKPYVYTGREAARYMLRVVAGLQSFVVGEQQIARQFHMAVRSARDAGAASKILNGLDKFAGALTKKLHEKNLRKGSSIGIHSLAARYIDDHYKPGKDAEKPKLAVVGMGEIGRKAAGLLEQSGTWKVLRFNRTVRSPGWLGLDRLEDTVPDLHGIVLCTGSEKPVMRLSEIVRMKNRRRRLWVMDLGVPAQVDMDRKAPASVDVVDLDVLVEQPSDTVQAAWVRQMEEEVEHALSDFEIFCRERFMVNFLKSSQALHENYIRNVIPAFINESFPDQSPSDRKKMLAKIRKMLIEYSSSLLEYFHSSLK